MLFFINYRIFVGDSLPTNIFVNFQKTPKINKGFSSYIFCYLHCTFGFLHDRKVFI